MLGQPEDVVTAIFLLVVVNYLMSFQKLGVLLPFLHLALSLGLLQHALDMAYFPTVVTIGCFELAVIGQVSSAITAITVRSLSVNNHDAGTCKFGALPMSSLQLLDISVSGLGDLAQVKSLLKCQLWLC